MHIYNRSFFDGSKSFSQGHYLWLLERSYIVSLELGIFDIFGLWQSHKLTILSYKTPGSLAHISSLPADTTAPFQDHRPQDAGPAPARLAPELLAPPCQVSRCPSRSFFIYSSLVIAHHRVRWRLFSAPIRTAAAPITPLLDDHTVHRRYFCKGVFSI